MDFKNFLPPQEDERSVPNSPNVPSASSDLREMALNKSPTLLAKYSAPNDIIATVDGKGQLSLSNTAAATGAKVIQVNAEQSNIQARMDQIKKEMVIEDREALLSSFAADMAEAQTRDMAKYMAGAESKLGLSDLRMQLAQSEQNDRRSPNYPQFKTDSTGTMQIRRLVDATEVKVAPFARELASQDPAYAKKVTEINNFIKIQEKHLNDMYVRNAQNEQRSGNREEIKQERVDEATSNISALGWEAVQAAYPDVANNPESLQARAYAWRKDPRLSVDAAIILNPAQTPQTMLETAVLGNTLADPYVIKKQQDLLGISPEQTKKELTDLRYKATPMGLASLGKAVTDYGNADDKKQWKSFQEGLLVSGKSAESRKQAMIEQAGWAIRMQGKRKELQFKNQTNSWQPVDGVSLSSIPEIDVLMKANQNLSTKELVHGYVNAAPKELQSSRLELINKHAVENAKRLNQGLDGAYIDLSMLKAQMNTYFIGGSLRNYIENNPSEYFSAGLNF